MFSDDDKSQPAASVDDRDPLAERLERMKREFLAAQLRRREKRSTTPAASAPRDTDDHEIGANDAAAKLKDEVMKRLALERKSLQ